MTSAHPAPTSDPIRARIKDVSQLRRDLLPSADLLWIELTRATLEDGVGKLQEIRRFSADRHQFVPNILVVIRSLEFPWREREHIRESVTAAGATVFELKPDDDLESTVESALTLQHPDRAHRPISISSMY